MSAGAQHAKAWEEYQEHGMANHDNQKEEKNFSDDDDDDSRQENGKKKLLSKQELIQKKSYGKTGKSV